MGTSWTSDLDIWNCKVTETGRPSKGFFFPLNLQNLPTIDTKNEKEKKNSK